MGRTTILKTQILRCKNKPMDSLFVVPKFATETEEADWWYDNRHLVEQEFLKGFEQGTLRRGTLKRRVQEAEARKLAEVSISLDLQDAARANAAAQKRGITYEAFVRMLVHQALEREEASA